MYGIFSFTQTNSKMDQLPFELLKKRQFGEIISDAFGFIRATYRPLMIAFFKYALPFVILGGYLYGSYFAALFNNVLVASESFVPTALNIGIFLICFIAIIFAYAIVQAIVFGVFSHYINNDGGELDSEYLGRFVFSKIWPLCKVYFLIFSILVLPLMLVAMLSFLVLGPVAGAVLLGFGILIYFFVAIYYSVSWYFAPYIMTTKDISAMEALRESKALATNYWWPIVGVLFVASLIAGVLSLVFTLPLQLTIGAMDISEVGTSSSASSMKIGLLAILSFIGSMATGIYTLTCLMLKYIDIKERKEGSSLVSKIESFGREESSTFENEGEY